jgi:hypothetical protein
MLHLTLRIEFWGYTNEVRLRELSKSVGAKHSDDYLSGNPGYLFPNASPCERGGRSIRIEKSHVDRQN